MMFKLLMVLVGCCWLAGVMQVTAFSWIPVVTIRPLSSTMSRLASIDDISDTDTLLAENAPLLIDYVRMAGDQLAKGDFPTTATFSNTVEAEAKLVLLQQNYKNLVTNAIPSLERFVEGTTTAVNLEQYGPWYVAVFCLFLAATQRNAGREEARRQLIDKIVSGELDVNEMVRKIKEEEETAARIKAEQEAEVLRREEEARLEREAEAQRLMEERLARAAAAEARKAARLQAEIDRKAQQEESRLLAKKRREEEAKRLVEERLAQVAAAEAKKAARLQAERDRKAQQLELRLVAKAKREEEAQRILDERLARVSAIEAKKAARLQAERDRKTQQHERRILERNEREARLVQTQNMQRLKNKTDPFQSQIEVINAQPKVELSSVQTVSEDVRTQSASPEVGAQMTQQNRKGQEEETSLGGTVASPLARVLAREFGLDIATIPATGAGGRVTADDVRNFLAPEETAPEIDQTVDYFFADVADDMEDVDVAQRSAGLFSALKEKTVQQLRDYLSQRGVSIRDKNGKLLRKAELILEVLEHSYASRDVRSLRE